MCDVGLDLQAFVHAPAPDIWGAKVRARTGHWEAVRGGVHWGVAQGRAVRCRLRMGRMRSLWPGVLSTQRLLVVQYGGMQSGRGDHN